MSFSQRRLRRWFRVYNRRYFGGRLPARMRLEWGKVKGCWGITYHMPDGTFAIQLDAATCAVDSRVARLTLLHEMVHVDLAPCITHGPRFEQEMQRLAAAGAMKGLW